MADRLQRLERDINFLQKQVYRNASGTSTETPAVTGSQAQAGLGQIQEQLRQLRGEIERVDFANRKLADDYNRFKVEVDLRLRTIEEKQAQLAAAQTAAAVPVPAAAPAAPDTLPPAAASESSFNPNAPEPAKEKTEKKPAATGKDFPNSNEHYNHAFRLLNAKNYSAAATSFDEFVKKYPADPLTANAYYWLGESYYARNDYTRSAEAFRKGFEANPDGQKAPDNLYKLAMSLSGVKRTNEACIVLQQIIGKYGDTAPRIRDKAASERTTLQCK